MTREEQIEILRKRINSAKASNAHSLMRVREDNDILPGVVLNLMNLQRDLTELRMLLQVFHGKA